MDRRIILAIASIFCFGYTFHALWLVYDLACIWSLFQLRGAARWMIVGVAAGFVASACVHATNTMWCLSLWDTLKHVFLWLYLFRGFYDRDAPARPHYIESDELYGFLTFAFVANAIVAAYQYAVGTDFDDIAGCFGPGATHSYGYFMILYFLISYMRRATGARLAAILAVSGTIAVVSESMGYFILLPLWFVASWPRRARARRGVASFATVAILIAAMSLLLVKTQPAFVDGLVSRVESFVTPDTTITPDHPVNGRGTAIGYAAMVGGWTGEGPGVYSKIYNLDGESVWLLDYVQITICEASHLLCEWGILGLGYVIAIFAVLIFALRVELRRRVAVFGVFALTMAHGVLLMDERIIFFEMLIILAIISPLHRDAPAPPQRHEDPRGGEDEAACKPEHHDLPAHGT